MTTYAILLPGDEDHWATVSPEERARAHAEHERFSQTLAERGPNAETVEQLTGTGDTVDVRPHASSGGAS